MTKEALTREHASIRCRECFADRPFFAQLVASYTETLSGELAETGDRLAQTITNTVDDPLRLGWIYAGTDDKGNDEFFCSESCALQ